MLTPRQRAYLLDGPGVNESKQDVLRAFDGPCALIVAWRKVCDELMAQCGNGRRPYGFFAVELRLRFVPRDEVGQLRAIRTLGCYRSETERRFVLKRLAEITDELRARRPQARAVA